MSSHLRPPGQEEKHGHCKSAIRPPPEGKPLRQSLGPQTRGRPSSSSYFQEEEGDAHRACWTQPAPGTAMATARAGDATERLAGSGRAFTLLLKFLRTRPFLVAGEEGVRCRGCEPGLQSPRQGSARPGGSPSTHHARTPGSLPTKALARGLAPEGCGRMPGSAAPQDPGGVQAA